MTTTEVAVRTGRASTPDRGPGSDPFARLPLELRTQVVRWAAPLPHQMLALQGTSRALHQACRQDSLWRTYCEEPLGVEARGAPRALPGPSDVGATLVQNYLRSIRRVQGEGARGPTWGDCPRKRELLLALYRLTALLQSGEGAVAPGAAQLAAEVAGDRGYLRDFLRTSELPRLPQLQQRPLRLAPSHVGRLFRRSLSTAFFDDEIRQLLDTVRGAMDPQGRSYCATVRCWRQGHAQQLRWLLCDDFDVMRAMLPLDPHLSATFSPRLRMQPRLLAEAVRGHGLALAEGLLHRTQELGLFAAAFADTPWALQFGEEAQRRDPELVWDALRRNPATLCVASHALLDDDAFATRVLAHDGTLLEFFSARVRASREHVRVAVGQNGRALQFAAAPLRDDATLVAGAVDQHGAALLHAAQRFWHLRRYVLAAVRTYPDMLGLLAHLRPHTAPAVSSRIDGRTAVYLGAASTWGADEEVTSTALRADARTLRHVCREVRRTPSAGLATARSAPHMLMLLEGPAAALTALHLLAVRRWPQAFRILTAAQQRSPAVFEAFAAALQQDAALYGLADAPLADDPTLTLHLFACNPHVDAVLALPDQDDPGVVQAFVGRELARNGLNLRMFGPSVCGNVHHVRSAVTQNGLALAFAAASPQDDLDTVAGAVQHNGLALCYASRRLADSAPLVALAVAQNWMALEYASPRVQGTYRGTPAHEAWQYGRQWCSKPTHGAAEAEWVAQWRRGEDVGAAWGQLWATSVERGERRPTKLHAGELGPLQQFSFFAGRDLARFPSAILSTRAEELGRRLPPPLVDLAAPPQTGERPGPHAWMPRELSTHRFFGHMQVRFTREGVRKL